MIIHYSYLIYEAIFFIIILIYFHLKLKNKNSEFKAYRIKKNDETKILVDEFLKNNETNLKLFFKFESGIVETLRTARSINATVLNIENTVKDARMNLEIIKNK